MGAKGTNQQEGTQPRHVPRAKALLVVEEAGDVQYYFTILDVYGYRVRASSSFREGVLCLGEEASDFVMVSQGTPRFEGGCVLRGREKSTGACPFWWWRVALKWVATKRQCSWGLWMIWLSPYRWR